MITIDIQTSELPDLETRVGFGNEPQWEDGTGPRKEIMWRARHDVVNKYLVSTNGVISYQFPTS
jgi:hypothetical protein